ncbi:hypothetical protein G9A89_023635 [Geosiphon pyriformis]|nr:hypothetical protein G9A89_023635 [Geosiphon pyriformis]
MNHFQNQSCPLSSFSSSNQLWQQEMHICHNCVSSSKLSIQPSTILIELSTYNVIANLLTTNLLALNTHHLSTTNPKAKTNTTKLEIINNSPLINSQYTQNLNFQNYLSLLVTPEDATSNKSEANQKPLTNNISLATITKDKLLTVIFFFEFKEPIEMLLFSRAALKLKPITAMYTDAKIDGQHIKLILDSRSASIDHAASTHIITANRATKTPIGKIDNFPFKVNNIIIPIKALVGNDWLSKANTMLNWNTQELQLSQNSHHTCMPATCGDFKTTPNDKPLIELEEKKKPIWEVYQIVARNFLPWELGLHSTKITGCEPTIIASCATKNDMATQNDKASETTNHVSLVGNNYLTKEYGTTFLDEKEYEIWRMENAKVEGIMPSKILEIKNNPLEPVNIILIPNPDAFLNLEAGPEEFYEHYQNLAPIREEQEQCLEEINTQLCDHCLIPCDFQYSTTIIQLTSRSSLAKKGINIKGGIIDTEYIENIIAMLQNNSEKTYIIDPNEKTAQAIFLSLVKVAQLVLVKNRKELGITARGI